MTKIEDLEFKLIPSHPGIDSIQHAHHGEFGSITVLDRMTGYGYRDVETGFRDKSGKFWLASGDFNIRSYPSLTVEEAIEKIKNNANTCIGA